MESLGHQAQAGENGAAAKGATLIDQIDRDRGAGIGDHDRLLGCPARIGGHRVQQAIDSYLFRVLKLHTHWQLLTRIQQMNRVVLLS